jgi:hypothetical protein
MKNATTWFVIMAFLVANSSHSGKEERILDHDWQDVLKSGTSVVTCLACLDQSRKHDKVVVQGHGLLSRFLESDE